MRQAPLLAVLAFALAACGEDSSPDPAGDAESGGSAGVSAGGGTGGSVGGSSGAGTAGGASGAGAGSSCTPSISTHAFDLAAHSPQTLGIMFSMSWFGLPSSEKNGAGPDPGWGNWKWGNPPCIAVNDPNACESVNGSEQRMVASSYHPLAGIYSSSGRDAEGLARIDLMLSTLRRTCAVGARIDAWSVQMNSVKLSSAHLTESDPNFVNSADLAYRALIGFLDRAEAQGMQGVIVPGFDTTWYWHFGDGKGIVTHADKLAALEDDIVELVTLANLRSGALKLDCRPLIYLYTGGTSTGPYISVADWKSVLDDARTRVGSDFYTIGSTTNPAFFEVFDAIAPWLQSNDWKTSTGSTIVERARDWTAKRHDGLFAALSDWPGRVVMGGVAPGFDDYTKNWGACEDRSIPRDPGVLDGQFAYFSEQRDAGKPIRGMLFETWDDFTEGSQLEPTVEEGTSKLEQLSGLVASYYGEPPSTDTTSLAERWQTFGQPRHCGSGPVLTPPAIDLACP